MKISTEIIIFKALINHKYLPHVHENCHKFKSVFNLLLIWSMQFLKLAIDVPGRGHNILFYAETKVCHFAVSIFSHIWLQMMGLWLETSFYVYRRVRLTIFKYWSMWMLTLTRCQSSIRVNDFPVKWSPLSNMVLISDYIHCLMWDVIPSHNL